MHSSTAANREPTGVGRSSSRSVSGSTNGTTPSSGQISPNKSPPPLDNGSLPGTSPSIPADVAGSRPADRSTPLMSIEVEIDWDQPGEILSPGCPHHPCLCIPGTRRLPVLSPIKKYGWWNKNGCCHLYCGSGHFHNIKIIVNGSNMTPFHWN